MDHPFHTFKDSASALCTMIISISSGSHIPPASQGLPESEAPYGQPHFSWPRIQGHGSIIGGKIETGKPP